MGEPVPRDLDHAPASPRQPRIEPRNADGAQLTPSLESLR
jgi:hypothetical protein